MWRRSLPSPLVLSFYRDLRRVRSSRPASWLIGVGLFLTAVALRLEIEALPDGVPFITFIPALTLTALLSGWRVASISAICSAFVGWWFTMHAPGDPWLPTAGALSAALLFLFAAAINIAVVEALLSLIADPYPLDTTPTTVAGIATLPQPTPAEAVLSLAAASLARQARDLDGEPAAAVRLAVRRLAALARLGRALSGRRGAEWGMVVRELCEDTLADAGAGAVTVSVDASPVPLPPVRFTTLALLTQELLIAALKPGSTFGPHAHFAVSLSSRGDRRLTLAARFDGLENTGSLVATVIEGGDMGILEILARHVGASIVASHENGPVVRIVLPP